MWSQMFPSCEFATENMSSMSISVRAEIICSIQSPHTSPIRMTYTVATCILHSKYGMLSGEDSAQWRISKPLCPSEGWMSELSQASISSFRCSRCQELVMQCDYCMEARVPGMATLCADVMASFIVSPSIPGFASYLWGKSWEGGVPNRPYMEVWSSIAAILLSHSRSSGHIMLAFCHNLVVTVTNGSCNSSTVVQTSVVNVKTWLQEIDMHRHKERLMHVWLWCNQLMAWEWGQVHGMELPGQSQKLTSAIKIMLKWCLHPMAWDQAKSYRVICN